MLPVPPVPHPSTESAAPSSDLPEDVQVYISSLENSLAETDGTDYGGGAWTDLYGIKTIKNEDGTESRYPVKVNFTSHARTPYGALKNLLIAIAQVESEYHLKPYNTLNPISPTGHAPAQNAPAQNAAPRAPVVSAATGAVLVPSMPPATVSAPVAPSGAAVDTSRGFHECDYFEVVLLPSQKIDIKFWIIGRQFAELTTQKTPEQAAAIFAAGTGQGWTREHFATSFRYDIKTRVHWKQGKANPKGGFYKDFEAVALR